MQTSTLRAFARLAQGPQTTSNFEGNADMARLFAKAQAEEKKAAEKAIVGELTDFVGTVNEALAGFDDDIRSYEAAIRQAREDRAAVVEAQAFGNKNGNYLPLLSVLGIVSKGDYVTAGVTAAEWEVLCTIPSGDDAAAE